MQREASFKGKMEIHPKEMKNIAKRDHGKSRPLYHLLGRHNDENWVVLPSKMVGEIERENVSELI